MKKNQIEFLEMKYIIIKNGIFNELDRFDKILALVEDKIFELDDEPEHIT